MHILDKLINWAAKRTEARIAANPPAIAARLAAIRPPTIARRDAADFEAHRQVERLLREREGRWRLVC